VKEEAVGIPVDLEEGGSLCLFIKSEKLVICVVFIFCSLRRNLETGDPLNIDK
jgi:hypothetical protein